MDKYMFSLGGGQWTKLLEKTYEDVAQVTETIEELPDIEQIYILLKVYFDTEEESQDYKATLQNLKLYGANVLYYVTIVRNVNYPYADFVINADKIGNELSVLGNFASAMPSIHGNNAQQAGTYFRG